MATSDLQKLVRAYNLIAASCDDLRAIAGPVSRQWIASEIESDIPLCEIPQAVLGTVRGKDILAEELFSGENIDPSSIDPAAIDVAKLAPQRRINSNRLPKLEPQINAAILAGNILLGVQRYGRKGRGFAEIENDLIVATIVRGALGRIHDHSALLPDECTRVTWDTIEQSLGPEVRGHLEQINQYFAAFQQSREEKNPPALAIPVIYANVIAAVCCADLRLSARAAGDQIFSTLAPFKRDELKHRGIDTTGEFPERPFLESDYALAGDALSLPGVDQAALREPMQSTLMTAVADVLQDSSKVCRLVGRRGKAIHEVHNNLPMMEYYNAAEHPDDIATVHVAALELMRHLDKCRRKAYNTMLAHAFHIAGAIETAIGEALQPRLASMALLHDIVEDGSLSVAGYDQSLHKLKLRFGGPLAAMVAELTDSSSHLDGEQKAQITLQWPHIAQPEKQYNVDRFSTMHLRPTDGETPYTLEGIIVKLSDTAVTFEEGIRNPELMAGWWRNSGARIYWAQNMRGAIVHPLIERLEHEILDSETAPHYATSETALAPHTLSSLRHLVRNILTWSDRYSVVNLAILAGEFGLDEAEHLQLQTAFVDPDISDKRFEESIVNILLSDARLNDQVARGQLTDKSYVTLYRFDEGQCAQRDTQTFLKYREAALWRDNIREQLRISLSIDARERDRDTVLQLYRQCMADVPENSASYSLKTAQLQ